MNDPGHDTPLLPPLTDLPALAARVGELIAEYHATVRERPVTPDTKPGGVYDALPETPPVEAESWDAILDDVRSVILPNLTHWQSPSFFGYFPSNTSEPAMLADLLAAGLGVQGMLWSTSPAATELEMRTLDWLASMIGLPGEFRFESGGGGGGVIQGTASECVLTSMMTARRRAMEPGSESDSLVAYTSTQAHSSIAKAARVIGLAERALRAVAVDDRLAMKPSALREAIERDRCAGMTPFFCAATIGTTSTGAVDPIGLIADVCGEAGVFLHVDAAWAGSALVCPEHRHIARGVERADAFNFNPHKWLLTNFDCSCYWVRDRRALNGAMSITPEYLRNAASESGGVIDYRDWHIPLGRRFRALKLWFVIRRFGVEGLRAHIRRHVDLAERFEALVRNDGRFETPVPRSLALVCLAHRDGDEATREVLQRVNATGRAFLTHTVVPIGGLSRYLIRAAIGGAATEARDIESLWSTISASA